MAEAHALGKSQIFPTARSWPSIIEYMGPELIQCKQLRLVVGMYYVGGFTGACITAPLADRIRRKWTAFVGALFSFIFNGGAGWVNPSIFIAFQFFVGLS